MKTALLAVVLLLAAQAKADLVAEAPAAEPLAPALAPAAAPTEDMPCPAPGAFYTSIEECDQAIAAGLDMAKEQGVALEDLTKLGLNVTANSTRSNVFSSTSTINGQTTSIKYRHIIYRTADPILYCCGLSVERSTANSTAVPEGMPTTSAAWGVRSFAATAALAAAAAALVM